VVLLLLLLFQSSFGRGRRDRGEMRNKTNDEGFEVARISMSTGVSGGPRLVAASPDDPPEKDTFEEDVDFDINYQQNGRVVGIAKSSGSPVSSVPERGKRSGW